MVIIVCNPLSRFPPGHAGSEQSSLPLFLRSAVRPHGKSWGYAETGAVPLFEVRLARRYRAAVLARGRRSLACASSCLLGIRGDGPSRCLRFVSPAALSRGGAGPHRENWPEVGVPKRPRAFSQSALRRSRPCGGRCRSEGLHRENLPELGVPSRPHALPPSTVGLSQPVGQHVRPGGGCSAPIDTLGIRVQDWLQIGR